MRYGHFDDAAKEYVIETPATPLPWINYLGNEDFFSLISNTGGGYSFYKDAKLRRITRYRYNNVPADNGSRCYYLSLMDSDSADAKPVETWSPTFLPCKTPLDSYKCRQGIGYTVFEASKRGIESKLTAFVPLHTNAEINRLDVTNTTDEPAVIDVTGSVEWCLWNAADDSSNFQRNLSTGEVEIERETDATPLYHKTEFKERRNHYAFYGVNAPVVGFDTSRDEFLGQFNGWDTPQVIAEGKAHDSVAHGWFPIAANRVRLELQPDETASLVFMLGYIEVAKDQKWEDPNDPAKVGIINKKPAHELFRRFATVEQVEAALKELNSYWSELLTTYSVDSGDEKLDRMVNIWHQYQCMVTFNMSRSASYYESGMGRGMGFRDSNQDLLGFVHLIPERARERIIDIASCKVMLMSFSAWAASVLPRACATTLDASVCIMARVSRCPTLSWMSRAMRVRSFNVAMRTAMLRSSAELESLAARSRAVARRSSYACRHAPARFTIPRLPVPSMKAMMHSNTNAQTGAAAWPGTMAEFAWIPSMVCKGRRIQAGTHDNAAHHAKTRYGGFIVQAGADGGI